MSNQFKSAKNPTKYGKSIKSILDRLVAAIALLVFSPAILIVAIAIYIRMGSPIVFTQPRPGKNGEVFQFYKFRTMTSDRDVKGNFLPDLQRITALGQVLRKTRLDEFSQLGNVIDVSLSTRKTCI